MEKNLAERFFFIRYWERGPHLRLRFKGEKERLESEVKPALVSHFRNYFEKKPSQRKEPEDQQWFPNNSIQYIPYEPELERYGGPTGILIAEEHFAASSDAVLAVIEESGQWDYDRALGAAIQLHLGFAFSLGMDLVETAAFYSHIFHLWFSRSWGYETDISPGELKKRRDITLNAFAENFAKQKATLIPYHNTLWNAFTGNISFEQEWLNRWMVQTAATGNRLKAAHANGELVFPQRLTSQPLWYILESYVHMTNNRLGILNRDEAFLGYLIKESLGEIFNHEGHEDKKERR
jgi:thiopeptide-type bacteriocin biosynthesis protein